MKYKYIYPEIVSDVIIKLDEFLKGQNIFLTEEEKKHIENKILNYCPQRTLKEVEKYNFRAYRIIIEYGRSKEKAFYPHVFLGKKILISTFKRYIANNLYPYLHKYQYDRQKLLNFLCKKLCELFSTSLFTCIEKAKQNAKKMMIFRRKGDKVLEIREGIIKKEHGLACGNLKKSAHVNWYPYEGIDEWQIFNKVAYSFENLEA